MIRPSIEADLRADVLGHQLIVARQNLDLDPVALEGFQGKLRRLQRRIRES